MNKCGKCDRQFKPMTIEERVPVGPREFLVPTRAFVCETCEDSQVSIQELVSVDLRIAAWLAQNGASDGASFRFMRKTIGMRALDLGSLLGVEPETISRWETGKQPVDRRAIAILGSLVLDEVNGTTTTQDRLRALQNPTAPDGPVRIKAA